VKSTVGEGSEFWIELVRCSPAQHVAEDILPAAAVHVAQEKDTPSTLLYVEDNPANMLLVEHIIEDHPHIRLLGASDGRSGIELALAHVPDVILMDINLPDISGIEAFKILHKDPATRHIPILALSANAMQHDIERGLEVGFFRYLTKPIRVNEFMNALDEALKLSKTDQSLQLKQEE
jgi:CheY-like chemotaxis protein